MAEQFRAGVMSLGWDPTTAQFVIEAYPLGEVDEGDDAETDDAEEVLRVRMPVGTAGPSPSAPAKWWATAVRSA